jgi:hypothetical protein
MLHEPGPFPGSLPPNPACTVSVHRALQRFMSSTTAASCITHTSWPGSSIACAPSPCGPPLTVARLAGRHPGDYYGHSVAIELAFLRRSHVHYCRTYQRDLGVPFVSFNAPTGHRSCTPEDCRKYLLTSRQGSAPVTGVFPAGARITPSGDWASGNPAFAISRGSPGAPPRTPGHGHRFPGLLFSPLTFRITGQPSDPKTPPPVPARYAGDTAVRLVAHAGCGPAAWSIPRWGAG